MPKSPLYKIYIDGKAQRDISSYVEKVTYEDCIEEDSYIKIDVYEAYALTAADDDDLITGKYIAFQFGYIGGALSEVHRVRIVDIEVNYTRTKLSVTLKCLDKGHLMRKRINNKVWKTVTTADVAGAIATDYGLVTEIDDSLTKVWASIPQGNRSDMDFLKYLAHRETGGNYVAYIRGYTLYVVKRSTDKESSLTYTWGDGDGTVVSFRTSNKDAKKSGEVEEVVVNKPVDNVPNTGAIRDNYQSKVYKAWKGKINNSTEAPTGTLGEYKVEFDQNAVFAQAVTTANKGDSTSTVKGNVSDSDYKQYIPVILDSVKVQLDKTNPQLSKYLHDATQDSEELDNLGNHHKKKHHGIEGTLIVEGNPALRPNTVITMAGVARVHVGNWLVFKVTHSISNAGYLTTLELRKNGAKKGLVKAPDKNTGKGPDTKVDAVKIPVFDANGKLLGYSSDSTDAKKGVH